MHRFRIATTAQLCPRPEQLWFHPGPVQQALLSPDVRRVLTVCGTEARLWDVQTGQQVGPTLEHADEVKHVAFSADSRRLLTFLWPQQSEHGEVRLWDAATGQPLTPPLGSYAGWWSEQGLASGPFFSPDSRWLLTFSSRRKQPDGSSLGGECQVWDAVKGKLVAPLRLERGVGHAFFSPDGCRVCTFNISSDQARLWDPATGQPVSPVMTYGTPKPWTIRAQSFSRDSRRLA